eukprot:CAMPEP_0195078268 /NCGR_PEP_ID=MMETSP0448-20130528/20493_1 /TAXON_ID=66468 /ORGANISM="Heterocapsa triquestra, Strain CCMP 448" /LENGTH=285 /DNA_ID=CAMNT_0040110993 /DNA_START=61 /DNA_END=915 /DNA_ORIENTATION=-
MAAAALMRCEYEAMPADGELAPSDVFAEIQAKPLAGVRWMGWRSEPLFFGLEKVIATCTLDEREQLSDAVLDVLESLSSVQSARLLSMEAFQEDTFEVCRRLFREPGADGAGLRALGPGHVRQFMRSGYTVLEDFLPRSVPEEVFELVSKSLATHPDLPEDGIPWRQPMPRNARGDVATWLAPDSRPGTDEVFAAQVLPAFQRLCGDLQSLLGLQGGSEQQLAWYPGDGTGYAPHTDALPDPDRSTQQRKATAILYCNPAWEPEHGGALRLWLPLHEGGAARDVE